MHAVSWGGGQDGRFFGARTMRSVKLALAGRVTPFIKGEPLFQELAREACFVVTLRRCCFWRGRVWLKQQKQQHNKAHSRAHAGVFWLRVRVCVVQKGGVDCVRGGRKESVLGEELRGARAGRER